MEVPAAGAVNLAEDGTVTLQGTSIVPGHWVTLTFAFSSGQSTTVKVPVVEAGGDYAHVKLPSSTTPSSSPSSAE